MHLFSYYCKHIIIVLSPLDRIVQEKFTMTTITIMQRLDYF